MEWIDVNKKVPDTGDVVIVVNLDGRVYSDMVFRDYEGVFYSTNCGDEISHWMPFPSAPQNEDDLDPMSGLDVVREALYFINQSIDEYETYYSKFYDDVVGIGTLAKNLKRYIKTNSNNI